LSEVKPYYNEKDLPYATGKSKYLEDDKVETGKVLRVTYITGSFENVATTEYVELGLWNGHAYVPLKRDKPTETSGAVALTCEIWLSEGQCIYAYFPDVADGEKMKLRVMGRWE